MNTSEIQLQPVYKIVSINYLMLFIVCWLLELCYRICHPTSPSHHTPPIPLIALHNITNYASLFTGGMASRGTSVPHCSTTHRVSIGQRRSSDKEDQLRYPRAGVQGRLGTRQRRSRYRSKDRKRQ